MTSSARAIPRAPVVIVGLDCITGLQSARILAARGIEVIGVAANTRHFCARTRVVRRVIESPLEGDLLVDRLVSLGRELDRPAVLLPCTDAAVLTISGARDELSGPFRFELPNDADVRRLMDKVAFTEHAVAHDLPIPPAVIVRERTDALAAAESLTFPVVLKPGLKDARWFRHTRQKAFRADGPADLLALHERAARWSEVLLVQEWVEGDESSLYSCNCYIDRDSVPRATFVAKKIRQWPPETGTSSLGEEVRDDVVLAETLRLFATVRYRGLGYVEIKYDAARGRHFVIEPNIGRPTGRSAIAEKGGVELLLAAYCGAAGEPLPEALDQHYRGVKWIYWRHDLQASAHAWRRGRLSFADWRRTVAGPKTEAVFAFRDPLPFAVDMAASARHAVRVLLEAVRGMLNRRREHRTGSRLSMSGQKPATMLSRRTPLRAAREVGFEAVRHAATVAAGGRFLELATARIGRNGRDQLAVLTFHRVADDDELYPGLVSARPDAFDEMMATLARDFHPVSLQDVLARRDGAGALPDRSVLVTFDDAYADFASHAWPSLRRHGVPAVLFVPTGFPGRRLPEFWWDRLYRALSTTEAATIEGPAGPLDLRDTHSRLAAFRSLRADLKQLPHDEAMDLVDELVARLGGCESSSAVLDWGELRRLHEAGVTLAPHSRTHPLLNRVSRERLIEEIRGSAEDLRCEIGECPPAFAYPSGASSPAAVRVLAEEGFRLAFTTRRGGNDLQRARWLELRRINVGARSSMPLIRLQMHPWLAR